MNLIEEAESLLLYQFSNSSKTKSLTKALVRPFEDVLCELMKIHHGRFIDEASGESLDIIGEIVNFKRDAMSDEEYRVWLKVAILLNIGEGTANDMFNILFVLFGEKPAIQIDEYSLNVVMFTFFKYPKVPTKILFSIIRRAVPIGTVCQFVDASSDASVIRHDSKTMDSKNLPAFQLDVTGFDESVFSDFFREGF